MQYFVTLLIEDIITPSQQHLDNLDSFVGTPALFVD